MQAVMEQGTGVSCRANGRELRTDLLLGVFLSLPVDVVRTLASDNSRYQQKIEVSLPAIGMIATNPWMFE